MGGATNRNETIYGLFDLEEHLVTRPITRPVARAVSNQSPKPFRHYFSLSGMGKPAHYFLTTWKHIEPNRADFVVTESESGAISVKAVRGGQRGLFEPRPHPPGRIPPPIKRYVQAIRETVQADQPDAKHLVVDYRGVYREVYLHKVIPLSLKREGCALRRFGTFILAVAEQRNGQGLPTDLRIASWRGGDCGCSDQQKPRLYLSFTAETTDGKRKLPDLLDKRSPARENLLRAITDGLERLSVGKPGVDPATLYPEPTLLPESIAQQLEFSISLSRYEHRHVQRSIALSAREAVFASVERTDTLLFLGVPIESTLRVRSDLERPAPNEYGYTSFHLIIDWTLTDLQGRQRRQLIEAKAVGIVDELRVALISIRSPEMAQPLPSRYLTMIERLRFGIKRL